MFITKQSESGLLKAVVVNPWGCSAIRSLHWRAHHPDWHCSSPQMLAVKNKGGIIWNHPGKEESKGLLVGLFQGIWFSLSLPEDITWRPWDWIILFLVWWMSLTQRNVEKKCRPVDFKRGYIIRLYLSEPQLSLGISHCSCGEHSLFEHRKRSRAVPSCRLHTALGSAVA